MTNKKHIIIKVQMKLNRYMESMQNFVVQSNPNTTGPFRK